MKYLNQIMHSPLEILEKNIYYLEKIGIPQYYMRIIKKIFFQVVKMEYQVQYLEDII